MTTADLSAGTKVVFETVENDDGTCTIVRRYLRFPDGSCRDLPSIAACKVGQPNSNGARPSAS